MQPLFLYSAPYKHYELFFRIFRPCLLIILLYFWSSLAFATEVKQAQMSLQGERYVLSADLDYQISDQAKEALQNGVPLFWTLHIKVMQQRDISWDKTLASIDIRYRLQYHALLNLYRVVIVQPDSPKGDSYNFSTLSAALDLMANLHNLSILDKSEIDAEKYYFMKIKAEFERDALPLPLRPIAYINPQWYLSSDWTVWPLLKK